MSCLEDGDGILESIFRHHRAKWHDSCRLHYNKTHLILTEEEINQWGYRRRYTKVYPTEKLLETFFFLWDKPAGNESLRKASTSECWRYNVQFLYSVFSLPKLAQSALHIITRGRPVTSITCSTPWGVYTHLHASRCHKWSKYNCQFCL